ncbi:MAG: hypothetical protein ACI4QN_01960 [Candidatus Coproplasma sp.]
MFKKKFLSSAAALSLAIIMPFTVFGLISSQSPTSVAVAETTETEEKSVFDGVLDLISEKGADVIKDSLPTVGDFLCAKVFDFIGIDYTDSYTKELKVVNEKLDSMQDDLKQIIDNQSNEKSQNAIRSFLNQTNVFSAAIRKSYIYFNSILQKQKDNSITKEAAKAEENNLYENHVKDLFFGSSSSTGDLSLQLETLCKSIVTPDETAAEITLMEHYHITYEYLWAFDMQSFKPKKDFLGYVSTTALQGLTLATFQHTYEYENAKSDLEKQAIDSSWTEVKKASDKAFDYLNKEIKAVQKAEKDSKDSNTTLHYATNKKISKKLYSARFLKSSSSSEDFYDGSNHYTYGVRESNKKRNRYHTLYTLDNRSFLNVVQKEYAEYVKNYKKPATFSFLDYLKEIGFTCDDWNVTGVYMGQRYKIEGGFTSIERFYLEYTDKEGKTGEMQWARWKSDNCWANGEAVAKFAAFVDANGTLVGSYGKLYERFSNSGNTGYYIYKGLKGHKNYTDNAQKLGKVW